MTTAVFITKDGRTHGFSISGHAGFDEAGKDIVCAAISSAATLSLNILSEIDKSAKIHFCNGEMSVWLSKPTVETEQIMTAFRFQLSDISQKYPHFLRLCSLNSKGGTHND